MRKLILPIVILVYLGGCASGEKRNPMNGKESEQIWWRGRYNWKITDYEVPNIYDPWSEDDLSKYVNGNAVGGPSTNELEEAHKPDTSSRTF